MNIATYITIIISTVFVNNFILSRFLGLCPFIGVSKNSKAALSMGMAVTFVTTMASLITWPIYNFILIPYNLEYLRTICFILVIASFVQLVEIVVQKKKGKLGVTDPLVSRESSVAWAQVVKFKGGVVCQNQAST